MPSVSVDPADEKLTGSPTRMVSGVAVATAVGATFGIASTWMSIVALSVAPSSRSR